MFKYPICYPQDREDRLDRRRVYRFFRFKYPPVATTDGGYHTKSDTDCYVRVVALPAFLWTMDRVITVKTHLNISSVVVDWRRMRLPRGDVPSPPHSPSGLRCGRESRRPRNFPLPSSTSSAAESGDNESRCVCKAAISVAAGGASGDRNGLEPRLPVLPPVGIPDCCCQIVIILYSYDSVFVKYLLKMLDKILNRWHRISSF